MYQFILPYQFNCFQDYDFDFLMRRFFFKLVLICFRMDSVKSDEPLKPQARELIHKLYLYFVNEDNAFKHLENGYFNKVVERVAKAAGLSRKTVIKILDDKDQISNSEFEPPKQKKMKIMSFRGLDNFEYNDIRNAIYNIQLRTKRYFSLTILQQSLVESSYQVSTDTLKKILKQMGFKRMTLKNNNKTRLLVEKPKLRLQRLHYIRKILEVRNLGVNIVYLGETYVKYNIPNEEGKKNDKESTSKERIIVMHAGTVNGFLPDTLMLSKCLDSDYYYNKVLSTKFQDWVHNQLIPTLPSNCLLVFQNVPLHNEILVKTKPPHAYSQKHEFVAWLTENTSQNIDPNLTKPELYDKICEYYKENTASKALQDYGHTVLRLPMYHTDFNPIEKLWVDLRGYMNVNMEGVQLSGTKIESLIKEKIEAMGKEEWSRACQEVYQLENEYLKYEHEFDQYTDKFVVTEVEETQDSDLEIAESGTKVKEESESD